MKPRKKLPRKVWDWLTSDAPIAWNNGVEAAVRMTLPPANCWPKDSTSPPDEVPYLFIRFPAGMTQSEKRKYLQEAQKRLRRSPANIPTEAREAGGHVIQQAGDNFRRMKSELRAEGVADAEVNYLWPQAIASALIKSGVSITDKNIKTLSEVQREGQRARGPGSDAMQKALKKRDDWIRKRYQEILQEESDVTSKPHSPRSAKEVLILELSRKNFGSWRGTRLSIKQLNKILRNSPRR